MRRLQLIPVFAGPNASGWSEGDEWRSIPKMSMWNEAGVVEVLRRRLGVVEQGDAANEDRDG